MNDTLLTDRRDVVIDRLSAGYADGAFEIEELERRLVRAHAAQSVTDLDVLVTDLAPSTSTALVPSSTALVQAKRTRVVFGAIERTGPWVVPEHLAARVLFGNLVLDLREARLAAGVTTIDVHVTMGNVEVIVPPGVEVDINASAFLANAEQRVEHVAAANAPVVRIVGRVRLGNLEVETRRLGETTRDTRRRRRAERRARRRWRHMCSW